MKCITRKRMGNLPRRIYVKTQNKLEKDSQINCVILIPNKNGKMEGTNAYQQDTYCGKFQGKR